MLVCICSLNFFKKILFIYLKEHERERERDHEQGGGLEGKADSLLSREPYVGLDPGP